MTDAEILDMTGGLEAPDVEPEPPAKTEVPGKDAGAPYGRDARGRPRRKPGPKPGARAPRKSAAARPATPKRTAYQNHRDGVAGILQLIAAPLAIAGQKNPVALADAAAITLHTPAVADGLAQVAEQDSRVAAILDRITQVGPYAAVIAPLVALGAQLAVNHSLIPRELGAQLGAHAPEAVIEHVAQMAAA